MSTRVASVAIRSLIPLLDALDISPANDNNPFVAPPSCDTVIEPRHSVLQILWGIIHRSNIDYAKRISEEFVQSIQTFLTDRKNLATAARGKKKTAHLLIPSVRFTKLIIHHLRTKHNIHPRTSLPLHYSHEESILNTLRFVGKDGRVIFGMPIPDALLTNEIKGAPYYGDYQEHVAKYQQFLDAEHGKAEERGAIASSDDKQMIMKTSSGLFFFSVTLIASSSSKSSSTKGDVLKAGGVSSNVTLNDSSTFLVSFVVSKQEALASKHSKII
ncbi:hypothetical protein Tco_1107358 [Tanacetum coccineum]